jgi:hypothetical protein
VVRCCSSLVQCRRLSLVVVVWWCASADAARPRGTCHGAAAGSAGMCGVVLLQESPVIAGVLSLMLALMRALRPAPLQLAFKGC